MRYALLAQMFAHGNAGLTCAYHERIDYGVVQ
jgi:hypothetical protein